jgi:hypothetical protein
MKIRYLLLMSTSLILALVLGACGGNMGGTTSNTVSNELSAQGSSGNDTSSGAATQPSVGEDFQGEMPISTRLGFGTLMLEDTQYAVDPAQAAELLPLWKAAKSLSESDTVAEVEMEAIFNQVQDTMTPEQLSAISEMEFTGDEMAQLLEDLGISFGFGGVGFDNLTPEMQATAEAMRASGEGFPAGGFPGAGFPGGGQGPGGGLGPGGGQGFDSGNLTAEQQATMEARRAERGGVVNRMSLVFVDPLIELLEERSVE